MRPNEAIFLSDWLTASFPPYLVIPNGLTRSYPILVKTSEESL